MIMADVLKIVFLILGTQIILVCHWLAAEALFPNLVERASRQYGSHWFKATLLGLVAVAPLLAVGFGLGALPHPVAKAISVVVLSVPALLGLAGSAGFCRRLGAGMPSVIDEQQPWRRMLRGGVVLVFLFLLPVIGWFIVLPWALVSGLGALLLSLRRKESAVASITIPPVLEMGETAR